MLLSTLWICLINIGFNKNNPIFLNQNIDGYYHLVAQICLIFCTIHIMCSCIVENIFIHIRKQFDCRRGLPLFTVLDPKIHSETVLHKLIFYYDPILSNNMFCLRWNFKTSLMYFKIEPSYATTNSYPPRPGMGHIYLNTP